MKTLLFIFLCSLLSLQTKASTFVGNGGNAGDLELEIAKREVQQSMSFIDFYRGKPEQKLCKCYPQLEGHAICDTLKKLTEPQVQYCAKFLSENTQTFTEALKKARITWGHSSIEVLENERPRAVDAVTNPEDSTITVYQNRFLEMTDYERLFLLTHELGHLLKIDSRHLKDTDEIGPFTGPDGGRAFLNAVAAGTVMEALDSRVLKANETALYRSQGHKQFWLEAGFANTTSRQANLEVSKKHGGSVGFRYQLDDNYGAGVMLRNAKGEEDFTGQIRSQETIRAGAVLMSYRFFPFKDPFTFSGQSHFVISAGVEFLTGEYQLADNFLETKAKSNSTALAGHLSYYLPLNKGFWLFARVGYLGHKYRYEIPYKTLEMNPQTLINGGVSYGF